MSTISMTYDQRCEIARFAMRNDSFVRPNDLNDLGGGCEIPDFAVRKTRFVFAYFGLRRGPDAQSRSQPFRFQRPKAPDPGSLKAWIEKSCAKEQLIH
jgi:hypothetical protein